MKSNEFTDLRPCLEYIYKNFGKEVFFSGRLSAYVKDLGPSIEESSVIRILERETNLTQIESISSIDINDRNFLVNDIIYKLPNHLNKAVFRSTLEIVILSLGVDLEEKKTQIQENISINTNTINTKISSESSEFEFDKSNGTIKKYLGTSKEITIPQKINGVPVKIIGSFSFKDIGIEKVDIPIGIEEIKDYAFEKNKIEILHLPESLRSIGCSAFAENNISKLILPNNIENIDEFAFIDNNLEKLAIPLNLNSIKASVFSNNKIKDLTLHDYIENIDKYAFYNNKIEDLTLPKNLRSIGCEAFADNNISKLTLYSEIEMFDKYAFDEDIIKFCLSNIINLIENRSLNNNKVIKIIRKLVEIEKDIVEIGGPVFIPTDNPNVMNCYYGNSPKVKSCYYNNAFLFDKSTGTINKYLGGSNMVLIPNKIDGVEVKHIDDFCFKATKNIETVEDFDKYFWDDFTIKELPKHYDFSNNAIEFLVLPSTLKTIGKCAFINNNLKELTLPESIEIIEKSAFMHNQIEELTIPEGIEVIGESAFYDNKIETLHIPASLKSIESDAFTNNNIKEIYLPHGIEYVDERAFDRKVIIHRR